MKTVLVDKEDILRIRDFLIQDKIVAFPTETVFGLAVKYDSLMGLAKLYELKARSNRKAITLMVASIDQIKDYAIINPLAQRIIKRFMPGMITIILKKKANVKEKFTAGLDTIGIRIPDDEFVLELLRLVGPLWVTSANISGYPDILAASDVMQVFPNDLMVVKGQAKAKIASTVVDLSQNRIDILRSGLINEEELRREMMKVAIACDHGGFRLKNVLKKELELMGYEVIDYGTESEDSCDYPDYAGQAALAVSKGECEKGVLVCGTGIGVSITANKVKGIRCALCHDVFSAKATRNHNDANMLAMGQRVIGEGLALEVLHAFFASEYEGGRHDPRIKKMMAYEEK